MKLLRFLKEIAYVLWAVCIVIISKEARIKAIQTWTNKAPFIMFEDGEALVSMNDVKDISLDQMGGGEWVIFVHRFFGGERGDQHTELYRSHNKSEAKKRLDSLKKQLPNVHVIPKD